MTDDSSPLLTIGQVSRRTGLPVRNIRYWSDIGVAPPAGRTGEGRRRLYDAASLARLELVRSLRELGFGLDEVRRVLERKVTVADVAAAQVAAIDARIRSLRLTRAVLSTVAQRQSTTEETALMNHLARASAQERKQIIEDFITEVFAGLEVDEQLKNKLRLTPPELPQEPSPEQVDAWVELADLVRQPSFRQRMRKMVEHHTQQSAQTAAGRTGTSERFTEKVALLVGDARKRGITPQSTEAAQVVGRLLEGADPARRAYIRQRLADGLDTPSERYHQLVAIISGRQPRPSRTADLEWLQGALDAHSA